MTHLPAWLAGAFIAGLIARQVGMPPLVGFLAAGFGFRAIGHEPDELLEFLSHTGVLILLFMVGLKVRLQNLIRPEVWGVALAHLALVVLAAVLLLRSQTTLPLESLLVVGAALGFSSTVMAAKTLEARRELRAFHGRVAIGILIIQDLVAVGVLATFGGHSPSAWSVGVLVIFLLRPVFTKLLSYIGHGELLVLFGVVFALAIGGYGFELAGLSPELGALVAGSLLADHPKAKELGDALWSTKEFLLVGFFLNIGLAAMPTWEMFGISLLLMLGLPLKMLLFIGLLMAFGLRARTAFLTALSLASYSEFGLIVTQFGVENGVFDPDWLIIAALTVALSFALSAPLNLAAHHIYERFGSILERLETDRRHPDDQLVSLGSAEVIVVGMGRIGSGAYDHLVAQGQHAVGLENDPGKLQRNLAAGRRVVFADAEDPGFWFRLNIDRIRAVLLALPDLEAKVLAAEQLRARGYQGLISATHVYEDERASILAAGVDVTYNNFAEAGLGFASHTCDALRVIPAAQAKAET